MARKGSFEVDNGVICDKAGRTSAPNVWALGDVASLARSDGTPSTRGTLGCVADQARVVVPALLGTDDLTGVVVPYFWSDGMTSKSVLGGARHRRCASGRGRKFLAYYERDGVLVGVVGGRMARHKVMVRCAARSPRARPSPVLDQTQA